MKRFLILLSFVSMITGCDNPAEKKKVTEGIIYRDIQEVSAFNGYEQVRSSVIQSLKDERGEFIFSISHFQKGNSFIVTFERLIREEKNPQVKYQILDTITITKANENEHITYCSCMRDSVFDEQIIALVANDVKYDHDQVRKAWRADPETQQILPLENVSAIKCQNENPAAESEEGM